MKKVIFAGLMLISPVAFADSAKNESAANTPSSQKIETNSTEASGRSIKTTEGQVETKWPQRASCSQSFQNEDGSVTTLTFHAWGWNAGDAAENCMEKLNKALDQLAQH